MPSTPPLKDKTRLLPLLWRELLLKIDQEWEAKYRDFALNRKELKQYTKFANALAVDIQNSLSKSIHGEKNPIKSGTLISYFKSNALPNKIRTSLVVTLINYLGYSDWESFANAHPVDLLKEQPNPNGTQQTPQRDGSEWMFWGP